MDRADKLLDLGFGELALWRCCRRVVKTCFLGRGPTRRTRPPASSQQPLRVDGGGRTSHADIRQRHRWTHSAARSCCVTWFKPEKWTRTLVFVVTKRTQPKLWLTSCARPTSRPNPFTASQGQTHAGADGLKASTVQNEGGGHRRSQAWTSTQLPVVVNYDLPRSAEFHLHRPHRAGWGEVAWR
jgi:hypothetical protein